MPKDKIYLFHQTPPELAQKLIKHVNIINTDILYEPFKGEGAFYNAFPQENTKYYTEIEEGLDYLDFNITNIDWVITNPPFRLSINNKRENACFNLLLYFSERVNKGIAYLINYKCLASLTPLRIKKLEDKNLYLHKIVICNIKKWRGRYYFLIFKKNEKSNLIDYIEGSY